MAVEQTASFPSPAQDHYEGLVSLDKLLMPRREAAYPMQVASDSLASLGIRAGDVIVVDRSQAARLGAVAVFVHEGEHRLARCESVGGRAALVTDEEELLLSPDDAPLEVFGVVTWVIHRLDLGRGYDGTAPAGRRRVR